MEELHQVDWTTLLVAAAVIVGVLATPYELLLVIQRRWEQQRRGQPASRDVGTPREDQEADG